MKKFYTIALLSLFATFYPQDDVNSFYVNVRAHHHRDNGELSFKERRKKPKLKKEQAAEEPVNKEVYSPANVRKRILEQAPLDGETNMSIAQPLINPSLTTVSQTSEAKPDLILASQTNKRETLPELETPFDFNEDYSLVFNGELDSSHSVRFHIQKDANSLWGYYSYQDEINPLSGYVTADGSFYLRNPDNPNDKFHGKALGKDNQICVWNDNENEEFLIMKSAASSYRVRKKRINKSYTNGGVTVKVQAQYPNLQFHAKKRNNTNANATLEFFINQLVASFERSLSSEKRLAQKNASEKFYLNLLLDYTVFYQSESAISLALNWVEDYSGRKNDMRSYSVTFTFDLLKNRQLKLKDLFQAGSNFTSYILQNSSDAVKQNFSFAQNSNGSFSLDASYFEEFYLLKDALVIRTNSYMPPNASKVLVKSSDIAIPYSKLSGILARGGALEYLGRE